MRRRSSRWACAAAVLVMLAIGVGAVEASHSTEQVPSGVARVVELQELGYAYVKP